MKRSKQHLFTARNGALVAASAVAAAASAWERTHRKVSRADLTESGMRIERLSDLRQEKALLQAIEGGLREEWGWFALLGFDSVEEMAAQAGSTIFVVVERDEEGAQARGVVQTILTDVHGDAELLEDAYASFSALTGKESWKSSRRHGGDTAVLLQITTLGAADQRGGGLGSLLRNAVLNMLPRGVEYALTTTPVDGATFDSIDAEDTSTYTPAMRFHARGGASPARILRDYKVPPAGAPETGHGRDIVVMRYARDERGLWPAKRPPMRVRSLGPLQERILRTGRSIKTRGLRLRRPSIPPLHVPSWHRPRVRGLHVSLPRMRRSRSASLSGHGSGPAL